MDDSLTYSVHQGKTVWKYGGGAALSVDSILVADCGFVEGIPPLTRFQWQIAGLWKEALCARKSPSGRSPQDRGPEDAPDSEVTYLPICVASA